MKKQLNNDTVRVIKIGKEALMEFIYESFMDHLGDYLDVDPVDVTNAFCIDLEQGAFICCSSKAEDENGKLLKLPAEIDLQKLMATIPDTTPTMYAQGRYKEYSKEELVSLSKL